MFAFVFESVGSGEWLVLLAVILIIVGPKNLPSAARKMGEIMSKLRRAADEFKRQLMTMDEEMKKTADEIKRDYIDIPEDNNGQTTTDAADAGAIYGDPEYDPSGETEDMSDYSERYPGEGYDETPGEEVPDDPSGPSEAAPDVAVADVATDADASAPAAAAVGPSPETPETTNG